MVEYNHRDASERIDSTDWGLPAGYPVISPTYPPTFTNSVGHIISLMTAFIDNLSYPSCLQQHTLSNCTLHFKQHQHADVSRLI